MKKLHISIQNKIICKQAYIADAFYERLKGLMFSKSFPYGDGLLIKKCHSIHTCFMYYSIDVLFLDENYKIVKIIRNLAPFKVTNIYFKASQVLEISGGHLTREICPGDQLEAVCIN